MKDSIKVWIVSFASIAFSELNVEHTLELVILLASVLFTIYKFYKSNQTYHKIDKLLHSEMICTSCGTLSSEPNLGKYAACCPINNYITVKEFLRKAKIDDE